MTVLLVGCGALARELVRVRDLNGEPVRGARVEFATGGSVGFITVGLGSPEGNVTASPGSLYLDAGGGAGTSLYVKESGAGTTGWDAK